MRGIFGVESDVFFGDLGQIGRILESSSNVLHFPVQYCNFGQIQYSTPGRSLRKHTFDQKLFKR
jgi:hypothetical protein